MRWSEERISHLAHQVFNDLWQGDLIEADDAGRALLSLKNALNSIVRAEEEVDTLVRDKLNKQKKIIGSHDWQILYTRYHREEMEKRGWA
ncbi:MAG: DUF507 family protein [Desulfuromonadales bacterium]|nr:DUF507 family protein [Desulfuromonadales bacterium]